MRSRRKPDDPFREVFPDAEGEVDLVGGDAGVVVQRQNRRRRQMAGRSKPRKNTFQINLISGTLGGRD